MAKKYDYKEELEHQRAYATSARNKNEGNPKLSEGQRRRNRAVFDKVIQRSGGEYQAPQPSGGDGVSELLEGIGLLRKAARKGRENLGSLYEDTKRD